ncbi:MAG: hypothetical protein GY830_04390 [Bacteroidetes bacterium]|nr:hypothetical protein [Bacteroidota bacterium]
MKRKYIKQFILKGLSLVLLMNCYNQINKKSLLNSSNDTQKNENSSSYNYLREVSGKSFLKSKSSLINQAGNKVTLYKHGKNSLILEMDDHSDEIIFKKEFEDSGNSLDPLKIIEIGKDSYFVLNKQDDSSGQPTYFTTIVDKNKDELNTKQITLDPESKINNVDIFDNEIILLGTLRNAETISNDLSLIHVDKNNSLLYTEILNLAGYQTAEFFIPTNNSYVIGGENSLEKLGIFISTIDRKTKNVDKFTKFEGGFGEYLFLRKMFKTKRGGYFMSGYTNGLEGIGIDSFALEFNNDSLLWAHSYGKENHDIVNDVVDNNQFYSSILSSDSLDSKKLMIKMDTDYDGNLLTTSTLNDNTHISEGSNILYDNDIFYIFGNNGNNSIVGKMRVDSTIDCFSEQINFIDKNIKDLLIITPYANVGYLKNVIINMTDHTFDPIDNTFSINDICSEKAIENPNTSIFNDFNISKFESEENLNDTLNKYNPSFWQGFMLNEKLVIYGAITGFGIFLCCLIFCCIGNKIRNRRIEAYRLRDSMLNKKNSYIEESDEEESSMKGNSKEDSQDNDNIEDSDHIIQEQDNIEYED